jgi:transketolase
VRNTFIKHLIKAAESDSSIYLIVGDVGFSVVEEFQAKFPDRFINAGIAEQSMIGIAAGLAMAGKNVFVYSIIPFVTMRCYEQIRNDICYQNLPVKLVGVGGGFSYGPYGLTHHAIEDVALMRTLSGMTIVAPGSKFETEKIAPQFCNLDGPAYLRLSNGEELVECPENTTIEISKITQVIPSNEYLVLASGNALDLGWQVCKKLNGESGIKFGLASIHTVKPLDTDFLISKQNSLKSIFTIEEHSVIGGLGEAVAKVVAERFDNKITFKSFGVDDFYFHEAGSRKYLLEKSKLSLNHVCKNIIQSIKQNKCRFKNNSGTSVV